jgi:hypothetical protein
VTSSATATLGTTISSTATCPVGKYLMGAHADINANGTAAGKAALSAVYPSGGSTITATAVVTTTLVGDAISIRAYAVCSV